MTCPLAEIAATGRRGTGLLVTGKFLAGQDRPGRLLTGAPGTFFSTRSNFAADSISQGRRPFGLKLQSIRIEAVTSLRNDPKRVSEQ